MSEQQQTAILVGGGKLAGLLVSLFSGDCRFAGYIDDVNTNAYVEETYGLPFLGTSEQLVDLRQKCENAVVAITNPAARRKYRGLLQEAGFGLVTLISPSAVVSPNASIGSGCIVRPNAVISARVSLADNCLVGDNAYIGHDTTVGESTTIAPGVSINGSVAIGAASLVGTGAVVMPKLSIGNASVVGASACVTCSVPDGQTVMGVPAKPKGDSSALVSVLLASYNHGSFIEAAIRSVLEQTHKNLELVIVDDGSGDDSVERIRSFDDPRIRFEPWDRNRGMIVAKRRCLELARGDYIAILNSDDVYLPEKLEQQLRVMRDHPEFAAVLTQVELIDENNKAVDSSHPFHDLFEAHNRNRQEWLRHFFCDGNCLCISSALFRRHHYSVIGCPDRRFHQLPDLDLWVRLCLQAEIHILPARLTRFRVHGNGANASAANRITRVRDLWESIYVYRHYLEIDDQAELLRVFPEACDFADPEFPLRRNEIRFVVAQMALKQAERSPRWGFFGLNTIFQLMADPETATQLHFRFGFAFRDLIKLTGELDVFGWTTDKAIQRGELEFLRRKTVRLEESIRSLRQTLGESPRLKKMISRVPRFKKLAMENDRLWNQLDRLQEILGENREGAPLLEFRPMPPSYFVSRKLGLAYLQIPKAACSSVLAMLLKAETPDRYEEIAVELGDSVGALHHTEGLLERTAQAGEMLRFTFVRHPFDRILSFYRNQVTPGDIPEVRRQRLHDELALSGLVMGMSFADYVRRIVLDPVAAANLHIRPQTEFLSPRCGWTVDFIGRVEEIDRSQKLLSQAIGRPDIVLPRLNVTGGNGWRESPELTPELISLLARRYALDLQVLGYSATR